jgi:transposase-like protein
MLIEIMEGEVAELAGGERYERSAERLAQRNGCRARQWDTRVGSLELAIPRLRSRSNFPSFLERNRGAGASRPS